MNKLNHTYGLFLFEPLEMSMTYMNVLLHLPLWLRHHFNAVLHIWQRCWPQSPQANASSPPNGKSLPPECFMDLFGGWLEDAYPPRFEKRSGLFQLRFLKFWVVSQTQFIETVFKDTQISDNQCFCLPIWFQTASPVPVKPILRQQAGGRLQRFVLQHLICGFFNGFSTVQEVISPEIHEPGNIQ